MTRTGTKRLLSLLLSMCMLLTLLPVGALAAEEIPTAPADSQITGAPPSGGPTSDQPTGDPPPDGPANDPSAPSSGQPAPANDTPGNTASYTWAQDTGALTVHADEGFEAFKTAVDNWNTVLQTVVIEDAVTAVPDNAFYVSGKPAENLTSVTFGTGVKSIGEAAFFDCTALETVTLPASLTTLGGLAFFCCDGLTAFRVADGSAHFKAEDGVLFSAQGDTLYYYPLGKAGETYTVPDGVKTVKYVAFATDHELSEYALRSITFPASVETLENDAVYLENLTSLTFQGTTPPTLTQYGLDLNTGCKIYVPQSAVETYKTADNWKKYADQILAVITETVTTDDYTFNPSTGAFTVKTNNGSTAWHDAGIDRDAIKSVTVAEGVTEIGNDAFMECTSLTSVNLGGVTALGEYAFADCTNLTSVDLGGVKTIDEGAFYSTGLTAITLPDSLTGIGDYAFNYTPLTTVKIPKNVETIGKNPFSGCERLTAITVAGENKKFTVENGALYGKTDGGNTRLITYPAGRTATEFAVPDTVTHVENFAFEGAAHLEHVRFQTANPPEVGGQAFYGCADELIFHVPDREKYASLSESGKAFHGRTVYAPPGAPTGVTARQVGKDNATLTWTAPADATPAVTGYKVWVGDAAPVTLSGDAFSYTFTELTRGSTYTFSVKAVNAEGGSAAATSDELTIAAVSEWDGNTTIANGDTLLLKSDYTDTITIPQGVTNLTIDGQGSPLTGVQITYASGYSDTLNLTLVNLNITAPESTNALTLPKNANLTVIGTNKIATESKNRRPIHIAATEHTPATVTLTLPGAYDALTLTSDEYGISAGYAALTLNNNGVLSIKSGDTAIFAGGSGTLTVNGTGALYARSTGSTALAANGSSGVTLNGGRVVAVGDGGAHGIYSQSSIAIGENVTGLAVGQDAGIGSINVTNNSPAFLVAKGAAEIDDQPLADDAGELNLSQQTVPKVWTNLRQSGGFAVWTPAQVDQPARLLLEDAYLVVDLILPSTDVELLFHDKAEYGSLVQNISGAANLTLQNLGGQTPVLKAMDTDPAVAATGGVTFAGGSFEVSGSITPSATLTAGELTIRSADGDGGQSSQTLTVTPNPVAARATLSTNYATAKAGADEHTTRPILGGAFTDSRTYTGADGYIHAQIHPRDSSKSFLNVVNGTGGGEYAPGARAAIQGTGSGTFTGWTPATNVTAPASASATYKIPGNTPAEYTVTANYSTGGSTGGPSGGVSSYAVVYKANYANAPADVRDGGHRAGTNVTLKAGSIFAAPEGKAFAGWAESAGGEAKYQGGEKIKMPANTLTLYALWTDGGAIPGLNRVDHMAYIAGYPDGRVGPNDLITREQTAMIFFRLLDEESRARYLSDGTPFPDVAAGRWSAQAIATLAAAGIVTGQSDGNFAPARSITRAEFAAIAARFDSDRYDGPDLFPDIAGHWAREQINRAAQKGWVKGGADGLFRPDDPITRAEAAALINRVLGRAPETADDLLPGMRTFTDNLDETKWYYLDIQEAANGHEYDRKSGGVYERWTELTD